MAPLESPKDDDSNGITFVIFVSVDFQQKPDILSNISRRRYEKISPNICTETGGFFYTILLVGFC